VPLLAAPYLLGAVLPGWLTLAPSPSPLAAAVFRHWLRAAPDAPVVDPCQAETALWCLGFPLAWPTVLGRRAGEHPRGSNEGLLPAVARTRPLVTLGTVQLRDGGGGGGDDTSGGGGGGGSGGRAHFVPVWRPRRLTTPLTHEARWPQVHDHTHHHHHSRGANGSDAVPSETLGGGGETAPRTASPPQPPIAVVPWVVSRSGATPLVYDGLGSGVWFGAALARKRAELEDAAAAAAVAMDPPHHHHGSATPSAAVYAPATFAGAVGADEEGETLPFAGRTVSALISALTPQRVRELARRIRDRRLVKVYEAASDSQPQQQRGSEGGDWPDRSGGASLPSSSPAAPAADRLMSRVRRRVIGRTRDEREAAAEAAVAQTQAPSAGAAPATDAAPRYVPGFGPPAAALSEAAEQRRGSEP